MTEHHDRSRAQEKRLAKETNGQQQARSGAGVRKGDVRSSQYLYEAKTTTAKSFSITPTIMETLRRHGYSQDRVGVLVVEIGGREYCVVPKSEWLEVSGG